MDVKYLLRLSEDELFYHLGRSLPKSRILKDSRTKGKNWFNKNKDTFAKKICPKYKTLANKGEAEAALEIAAIIGDELIGIPSLIISVIILKLGLKSLCK